MSVDDCETGLCGLEPHDHAVFMRFPKTDHLGHSQVLDQSLCKLLKRLVGERGFEPPTPWSRTKSRSKSKSFIRCRLGARKPVLLLPQLYLSCTDECLRRLADDLRPFRSLMSLCSSIADRHGT